MRVHVVACWLLVTAAPLAAFDEECFELGLGGPGARDRALVVEVEREGPSGFEPLRSPLLEDVSAGGTVKLRIAYDEIPGRQIVADVVLAGDGGATLSRPGTDLSCRRMRWLVTMVDETGAPILVRDRFEVRLGPLARLAHLAPDPAGIPSRPRWQLGDALGVSVGFEEPDRYRPRTRWARATTFYLHSAARPAVGLAPAPPLAGSVFEVDRGSLGAGATVAIQAALMAIDEYGNEAVVDGIPAGLGISGPVRLAPRRIDPYLVPLRFDLILAGDIPAAATLHVPTSFAGAPPTAIDVRVGDGDGPRITAAPVPDLAPTRAMLELVAASDGSDPVAVEVRVEDSDGAAVDDVELGIVDDLSGGARSATRLSLELTPGEPQRVEVAAAPARLGALWWSVGPAVVDATVNGCRDPAFGRRLMGRPPAVEFLGAGAMTISHTRGLLVCQRQDWVGDEQPLGLRVEWEQGRTQLVPLIARRVPGGSDWAADLLYVIDGAPLTPDELDGAVAVPVPFGRGSVSVVLPDPVDG